MRTVNAATVHLAPLCVRRVAPELAPAVVLMFPGNVTFNLLTLSPVEFAVLDEIDESFFLGED